MKRAQQFRGRFDITRPTAAITSDIGTSKIATSKIATGEFGTGKFGTGKIGGGDAAPGLVGIT